MYVISSHEIDLQEKKKAKTPRGRYRRAFDVIFLRYYETRDCIVPHPPRKMQRQRKKAKAIPKHLTCFGWRSKHLFKRCMPSRLIPSFLALHRLFSFYSRPPDALSSVFLLRIITARYSLFLSKYPCAYACLSYPSLCPSLKVTPRLVLLVCLWFVSNGNMVRSSKPFIYICLLGCFCPKIEQH